MLKLIIFLLFTGKQGRNSGTSYITSTVESSEQERTSCPLSWLSSQFWAAHIKCVGLPTSVNNSDTPPPRHAHSQPDLDSPLVETPPQVILGCGRLTFRTSCHKYDHSCVHQRGCDALETSQVRPISVFSCLRGEDGGAYPLHGVLTKL